MKDDSLPPILRVDNPILATVFGATLATKRTTAENIVGKHDYNQLIIEPFANPFRSYPLSEDYANFYQLFQQQTTCYILNTDSFNDKNISSETTLAIIESIIHNQVKFIPFDPIQNVSYLPIKDYYVNFTEKSYLDTLKIRMNNRLDFMLEKNKENHGYHALPLEAIQTMEKIIQEIDSIPCNN